MADKETQPSKTFIKKWVKALRSGKFDQTQGVLRSNYNKAYCCLGVALEIDDKCSSLDHHGRVTFEGKTVDGYDYLRTLGISEKMEETCIKKNDGYGTPHREFKPRSFKQIADWLEKKYL